MSAPSRRPVPQVDTGPEAESPSSEDRPRPSAPPAARGSLVTDDLSAGPSRHPLAGDFRRQRNRRDRRARTVVGVLLVAGLVTLAVFFGPGASPYGSQGPSNGGSSSSGPSGSVSVTLGPVIVATTTCADGESTTMEILPWVSASAPVSTNEIMLEIHELIDGDIDGGPTAYPSVSASYVCGAPLQSAWTSWYAVLQNPAGINVAFFSYSQGWVNLNQPGVGITIENGSTLAVLSDPSYAGVSFALCVLGDVGAPTINECGEL